MSNIAKVESRELGHSLVTKTANAAHDAVDVIASRLSNTEDKLRNVAADSANRLAESQEQAKTQMKKSMQYIRTTSRKNPLAVAGIAFAIGAVAALLFRRGE